MLCLLGKKNKLSATMLMTCAHEFINPMSCENYIFYFLSFNHRSVHILFMEILVRVIGRC